MHTIKETIRSTKENPQNNIMPFRYEQREIRVVQDDQGDPWWVAKDICAVLEHSNHKMAMEGLDDDEVRKVYLIDSLNRKQETLTINESGLYTLILRSNKPQAKPFRKWVTHEVLPSLRKTGKYAVPGAVPEHDSPMPNDTIIVKIETYQTLVDLALKQVKPNQKKEARLATKRLKNDDILDLFLDDCYVIDQKYMVDAKESYNLYLSWCKKNAYKPMYEGMFGKQMAKRFDRFKRITFDSDKIFYEGIVGQNSQEISSYQKNNDILDLFLDDCCVLGQECQIKARAFYNLYLSNLVHL